MPTEHVCSNTTPNTRNTNVTRGDHDIETKTSAKGVEGRERDGDDGGSAMGDGEGNAGSADADADTALEDGEAVWTMNPLDLHLRTTAERGRGVFTSRSIPPGTLLEESPVLLLSKSEWDDGKLDSTVLGSYGFCWSTGGMAIGLGLASMFNHSITPNVNFVRSPSTSSITFRTSRQVDADEELCICYSADETKLWFAPTTREQTNGDLSEGKEDQIFPQVEPEDLIDPLRKVRVIDEKPVSYLEAKERRKAKYFKQKRVPPQRNVLDEAVILSPQPIPFIGSIIPDLPGGPHSDLPTPLHNDIDVVSRHEHVGPVVLTPDLDWREDDWFADGKEREGSPADGWGEVERIKGPAEREDEDGGEESFLDIWVVDVTDPRLTGEVLSFSKENCATDSRMRHLKRVTRRPHPDGDGFQTLIALCAVSDATYDALVALMTGFHPILTALTPFHLAVPSTPARNVHQLRSKSAIWPTLFSPSPVRETTSSAWSPARKAWVTAGIHRVLSLARSAKVAGELPVAVYCTAPPAPLWPGGDAFIPPTPDLRGSSHDTRISEAHPLRHATLNCIASIARLRTVPPFSVLQPKRNGADYLLTSLSLFVTHEPCVMCCMALLHSRVREVFYVFPRTRGGGFEGAFGVHGRKDLNHRFEVWRWTGESEEGLERELEVEEGVAI